MSQGNRSMYIPTGGIGEMKLVEKTIDRVIQAGGDYRLAAEVNCNFLFRRLQAGFVRPDSAERARRTITHLQTLSAGAFTAKF